MHDFSGGTAVITGGASGIGLAVARRLAREGMNLVLADIEQPALDKVVKEFESLDIPVIGVETDVSDADAVRNLASVTADRFGNVHFLLNNAGVAGGGTILNPDDLDLWHWVLGIDLFGVLHGIKAFGPAMIAHGEPCHIVNTASVAGLMPAPSLGSYTVAKYGVVAMSETLSLETTDTNLGVSVLCPGFVQTNLAASGRNLPESLVDPDGPSEEDEFLMAVMKDLLAGGIPPQQVADDVLDAVKTDRFYILPHPQYAEQIRARAERIATGRPPATWEM